MVDKINLAELRARTEAVAERQGASEIFLQPDVLLALIDTADAALALDIDACTHGLTWAESEGAANNGDVYPQLERLRQTIASYITDGRPA